MTAARRDQFRATDLGALADLGFLGLDDDADDPVVVTGLPRPPATASSPPAKRTPTGPW
ncbi:hypothetical protein ACFYXH_06580 [Streptomyces sp. NPDC002730]|uniref:hypothetical protein n=1 Tax=Streptomyces sp. NPDC002730 TaxID=3364662 RepID=UPI0036A86793